MRENKTFLKAYRNYRELLADAENVTDHDELIRLDRIKRMPESVRAVLEQRATEIMTTVMVLEQERDEIMDYLNGEVLTT